MKFPRKTSNMAAKFCWEKNLKENFTRISLFNKNILKKETIESFFFIITTWKELYENKHRFSIEKIVHEWAKLRVSNIQTMSFFSFNTDKRRPTWSTGAIRSLLKYASVYVYP